MPELPEVETTRKGIDAVATGKVLQRMVIHDARMRWPIPSGLPEWVKGQRVNACRRRGKYLLLEFDQGTQLIHLGMSGSLRSVQIGEILRKHDHVEWHFEHLTLRLHDPRRFGAVLRPGRQRRGAAVDPADLERPEPRSLARDPLHRNR